MPEIDDTCLISYLNGSNCDKEVLKVLVLPKNFYFNHYGTIKHLASSQVQMRFLFQLAVFLLIVPLNSIWCRSSKDEKISVLEKQVNDLQLELQQKTVRISELEKLNKKRVSTIQRIKKQQRRWSDLTKQYVSMNEKIQKEDKRRCYALLDEIEKVKEFVDARDREELYQELISASGRRIKKRTCRQSAMTCSSMSDHDHEHA